MSAIQIIDWGGCVSSSSGARRLSVSFRKCVIYLESKSESKAEKAKFYDEISLIKPKSRNGEIIYVVQ